MRSLCLLILACVLFSCQSKERQSQTRSIVRLNIGDEPQTLDPRKASNLPSILLMKMLFEGLVRINPDNVAELALAEKVDISEDLKTYTVTLKESFWSNGDPVTASDFVSTWKKTLSPLFPSDAAFHLYPIKNARAAKEGTVPLDEVGLVLVDARTFVIELAHPTPYFLELLAFPAFFPVSERLDRYLPDWALHPESYVSNGPFVLKEWKHQDHLLVEKNGAYWDRETVRMAGLELLMVEAPAELALFEKKEMDWAGSPLSVFPPDAVETLEEKGLNRKEMLRTSFVRTNTERFPFDQARVRQAFALAIDRGALSHHVMGKAIPATGLVPLSLGLQEKPYFVDGNRLKARELVQGMDLSGVSLIFCASERNRQLVEALQQQWKEALGVDVHLEGLERKVFFDRVSRREYCLSLSDWIADFADPINFLEVFQYKTTGSNKTGWENGTYATLLERSQEVLDLPKRRELLQAAETVLMEEMPIIPLFYSTMLYVVQDHLKNVFLSSLGGLDFKWAFMEEE